MDAPQQCVRAPFGWSAFQVFFVEEEKERKRERERKDLGLKKVEKMTANLITGLFGKYLRLFFKGFKDDLLQIDMFGGVASMRQMEMREDIMQELLDVDFLDVKRVFVPNLTIRFSLTSLKTVPISVHIDRIEFFIEEAVRGRPKTTILADFFGLRPKQDKPKPDPKARAPAKPQSSGSYGFMDKVADGLQVNVGEIVFTFLLRRRPGRPSPPKVCFFFSSLTFNLLTFF